MDKVETCSGWVLDYITALDVAAPGVAGAYLRSSDERRQCIAALLAVTAYPTNDVSAQKLVQFFATADHRELLVTAFGHAPAGLRGALRRAGAQAHCRDFYPLLFRLLSNPGHGRILSAIAESKRIDFTRLRIIEILPEDLCSASFVEAMGEIDTATDAIKLTELMAGAGVDRVGFTASLRAAASPEAMSKLWQRWALKANFPVAPVGPSASYKPTTNGLELQTLARRYRNCALSYLSRTLDGECAFAEFQHGGKSALVHLSLSDCVWQLEGILGPGNCCPGDAVRTAATDFMIANGIQEKMRSARKPGAWRSLRRFSLEHWVDWDEL